MDQDSAFMSNLMSYLFRKLHIKIMTVAPYNHQSLQAELWYQGTIPNFDKNIYQDKARCGINICL